MPVIILDGPEKAGKSTLARNLQLLLGEDQCTIRHWGLVPEMYVYMDPLWEDVRSNQWVVWDRSWASESTYGYLLGRERKLAADPWLGEWTFSRMVQSNGIRIMVQGPTVEVLRARRTPDDLPVDPEVEQGAFFAYARTYGWRVLLDDTANPSTTEMVLRWALTAQENVVGAPALDRRPIAPIYVGPPNAPVVFVGDERNANDQWNGRIPFGSFLTSKYGRAVGNLAFECGWTNTDCPPEFLRGKTLIACGQNAAQWCHHHGLNASQVPHPAWLYRYGYAADQREPVEREILDIVSRGLNPNAKD